MTKNDVLDKIHKIHLEMLKNIDMICRENNINYMLAFGSALGAVRHNGFIPWDDDVDIIMSIEDYLKFSKVKDRYFGDTYFLQDSCTEKEFPFVFPKMRKNNTYIYEKSAQGVNINEGIWIDIFILVNGCKTNFGLKIQDFFVCFYQMLKCRYRYLNHKNEYKVNLIKKAIYNIPDFLYTRLEKVVFSIIKNIGSSKSDKYYTLSNDGFEHSLFDRKWYDKLSYHVFENSELLISDYYDDYLSNLYGDYMKPVKYEGHIDYSTVVFEM